MKTSQELFNRLQPGDLVLIKTPGQLIDSGWKMFGEHFTLWTSDNDIHIINVFMILMLGKQLYVDRVEGQEVYFENCEYGFTIEMIQEIYPLTRGIMS